jgi:hypothetical protein
LQDLIEVELKREKELKRWVDGILGCTIFSQDHTSYNPQYPKRPLQANQCRNKGTHRTAKTETNTHVKVWKTSQKNNRKRGVLVGLYSRQCSSIKKEIS